jgi:apolipoprotein D and lipocalin family protein
MTQNRLPSTSSLALIKNLVISAIFVSGCSTTARLSLPELQTVSRVDLKRYLGTWYEIASFPQSFQKGCTGTMATYALRTDGMIEVVNQCRKPSLQGEKKVAHGKARVVDQRSPAKLAVTFFWPFWGDYWIIDLDPDYQYAVVGHPSRDYLWILSRKTHLEQRTYEQILGRLARMGYETHRLQRTLQPPDPGASFNQEVVGSRGSAPRTGSHQQ